MSLISIQDRKNLVGAGIQTRGCWVGSKPPHLPTFLKPVRDIHLKIGVYISALNYREVDFKRKPKDDDGSTPSIFKDLSLGSGTN